MRFHQKLQHAVDYACDSMFKLAPYWAPSIGVAMLASLFVFSGENIIPEAMNLAMPVVYPVPQAPVFGVKMPTEMMQGGPEAGEEDE